MYKNPMRSLGCTATSVTVPETPISGKKATDNEEVMLEVLSGISSCFIYIPLRSYNLHTEEYLADVLGPNYLRYREKKTVVLKTRTLLVENKPVPEDITVHAIFEDTMRAHLARVQCKCGCTIIQNDALHRLPSEGWEEMVDAWSCHSREFEHLAQKPLRPRKTGVLFHPLYFLIGTDRSPACLKHKKLQDPMQVFYNEVTLGVPDECLLFHYLYEIFQAKRKHEINGQIELVCLEITQVYKGPISSLKKMPNPVTALKLAYKKKAQATEQASTTRDSASLNAHFAESLLRILNSNSTGTWNEEGEITFIRMVHASG